MYSNQKYFHSQAQLSVSELRFMLALLNSYRSKQLQYRIKLNSLYDHRFLSEAQLAKLYHEEGLISQSELREVYADLDSRISIHDISLEKCRQAHDALRTLIKKLNAMLFAARGGCNE